MLIVGLGNPGSDYVTTRHNLGFMLIDKLAADERILVKRRECNALVGQGEIEGVVTKLAKPQTYMNLSGDAVACLLAKLKSESPVNQLFVISDDLALPLAVDEPELDGPLLSVEHDVPRELADDGRHLLHREGARARVLTDPARFGARHTDVRLFLQLDSAGRGLRARAEELLETIEGFRLELWRDEQLDAAA